jgi:hypothetical protein
MAELSRRTGLAIALDADGKCVLKCEDNLECEIFAAPSGETILLSAPISAARPGEVSGLSEFALQLNSDLSATRGCALSLDPRGSRLVMQWIGAVADLDETAFMNRLGGFILTATDINKQMREYVRSGGRTDQHPSEPVQTPETDSTLLWSHIRA